MQEKGSGAEFSRGWGFAGFIAMLAIGSFALAGIIKKTTFHSPNDPLGGSGSAEKTEQAAH
ncbi:MAG: hypothetical protein ACT4OZ_13410 [Gemmatimonadota bacterium]